MTLNSVQIAAINKIGNLMCPGDQEFPSFSKLGNVEHIDVLLNELPPSDLRDLKLLLLALGLLPSFLIKLFLDFIEIGATWDNFLGTLFRTVKFGFRGIIFALYYSGLKGQGFSETTPSDLIGYKIQMNLK